MKRLALIVLLGACGGGSGGSGADGGARDAALDATLAPDSGLCMKRWHSQQVAGTAGTATYQAGGILLHAGDGDVLRVKYPNIKTNFDATLELGGIAASGASTVRAFVDDATPPVGQTFSGGIVLVPVPALRAAVEPTGAAPSEDIQPAAVASVSVAFHKVGNSITVTVTGGGVTATRQAFYGVTPLEIGVEVAGSGGEAGARLTSFQISGGGGFVTSDDFACNSLY